MSFPNIIFGDYGEEKVAQSAKIGSLPLGQIMILPDGRMFQHAQAGGTALEAGAFVSTSAGSAGHGNVAASGLIASATATYNQIGDTVVHVAASVAAFTVDQFAGGLLNVQKSAGIGHVYKIKSNKSAASVGGDLAITLEPTDPLKVAWAAGSTCVSLRKNVCKDAIVMDASSPPAKAMGGVPVAVSASFYFWAAINGPTSLRTAGTTITDGSPVICSTVTAGSVTVVGASSADYMLNAAIGHALESVTAAEAALVDLTLK